jgi:para-nitrobenzyl esterase
VDGDVLPDTPWAALVGGSARDIDLIAGHNRDEYRLFLALAGMLGPLAPEQVSGALRLFRARPDPEAAYRTAYPDASDERLFELVQSDWLFPMPSLHLAQAQAAGGGRAFAYELILPRRASAARSAHATASTFR